MTGGPSYLAILTVEKTSAAEEVKRRFVTKVYPPENEKNDFSGEAVFADSITTRNGEEHFREKRDVEGKFCVCETLGSDALEGALSYARREKALALIATEEPKYPVDIPTILISRDQLHIIKTELPDAYLSVSHTSGSYETHPVTFSLNRFDSGKDALEWEGKMRVPASTTDYRELKFGFLKEAIFSRNPKGQIVEFLNKDEMAGKVCLVQECADDRHFTQIARLAGAYGAIALFTAYETPTRNFPCPVVVLEKKQFQEMKKPGVSVSFKFRSSSTPNKPCEPEPKSTPTEPKSYASAVQGGGSKSPSKESPRAKKNFFGNVAEKFGTVAHSVGMSLGLATYKPQSKTRFETIIARGTSWSKDKALYYEARDLLRWVESVDVHNREVELEALNEAIGGVANNQDSVPDVMVVEFCAQLQLLLSDQSSRVQLNRFAVKLIEKIKIDESDPISTFLDSSDLDGYIVKLVMFLSHQKSTRNSMKSFVVNALWIRVHHCQCLKEGLWYEEGLWDLRAVAAGTLFRDEQKTLLSFMSSSQFNTLFICTSSLRDVCAFFSGQEKVTVFQGAIGALLQLYQIDLDSTKQSSWQEEFHSIREVLTLLDCFEVENREQDQNVEHNMKKKVICNIIQRIERNLTRDFSHFECVYDCLQVHSKLHDFVAEAMMKSICSSLENKRDVLTPSTVSNLLEMKIGRYLLSNQMGSNSLKNYVEHSLFKPQRNRFPQKNRDETNRRGNDWEKLLLLSRIFISFSENDSGTEASRFIYDAIERCIEYSWDCYGLCLDAIDLSQDSPDLFYSRENSEFPLLIGKIIVSRTGICSTVRASPSTLQDVSSRFKSRHKGRLSDFLYLEFLEGLRAECKNIDDAISFFCKSESGHSMESKSIANEIVISSFGEWNPSSVADLLKFDAKVLNKIHDVLRTISVECSEERDKKKGMECLGVMHSVADNWREKFDNDKLKIEELQLVRGVLTEGKQDVLTTILSNQFPSTNDIDEKVAEMNRLKENIRASLTFPVVKDDEILNLSIGHLATHFRLKFEATLSNLISRYFSDTDPGEDLSSIRRHSTDVINFVSENQKELQAASHFRVYRSALFQNEVGIWAEIHLDDFLARVSLSLQRLECLLSAGAKFSSVSAAAIVLDKDNVSFDSEMSAIVSSLPFSVDEQAQVSLKHAMTLSKMAKRLSNFVECCRTYKFAFVTSDDCFGELETICNDLNGDEGGDWDIAESLIAGKRIVEILEPRSVSADLSEQLEYYLPLIDFFDALRHCSSIFDLAREKGWFGKKGVRDFYQEFGNVTNVIKHKQSFEMAVLDRLEPTINCISAVGGNLQCDRVATLLQSLDEKSDIKAHQNIAAMRLVQENICKIQDWLSEGMDDMAAKLGTFALIQTSGRIIVSSEESMVEETTPKRAISLHFCRNDGSDVTMQESEVQELVQYLGFATHESDESRLNVETFVRVYDQCVRVKASQQAIADVGYGGDDAMKRLEFVLGEHSEELAVEWLGEVDKMLNHCKDWLGELRSSNRYSLLFWMNELRFVFKCMRAVRHSGCSFEQRMLVSVLSQLPLNPNCSHLIAKYAEEASFERSWLEEVSVFITKCGDQSDHLDRTPTYGSKSIIIHKVDCLNETLFAAQLHLMQQIYKNQRPESFQYLDASCIRSSNHVSMFLERVRAFPEYIFVITHVERLGASEQELIATFIAKHAKSVDTIRLHCIQSKDTVLYASPGVSISAWDDSLLAENCPISWLHDCIASKGHVTDTTIVFSDAPCYGKTRYIRKKLEEARVTGAQTGSIYIHEDFTLAKAVEQLRNKFGEGGSKKSIHFAFSWSCDCKPNDEFLLAVNHFFNSFLLFGNVYDPTCGNSFYGSSHEWDVFVEMNICAGGEEAVHSWLREHVPILSYCSSRTQQPPCDFDIDEKARRVALYLRAYDDGSIDRKFNSTPANKSIVFVLDKSGSMQIDVGGRSRFQVASESMLSLFNSHIQVMDNVGLILFDHDVEEAVPLQRVESEQDMIRVRRAMSQTRVDVYGGTMMYTALRRVLASVRNSTLGQNENVWVVCLTDGESSDGPDLIHEQLRNSPDNIHVILIGVGLKNCYHQAMRDLCNKYNTVNHHPNNKGIFLPTSLNIGAIEETFNQVASLIPVSQTFELDGAMSTEQCRAWLDRYRPRFISPLDKMLSSFWVSFIYRRVSVFDASEDFNYNETNDSLGSSLMEVMLRESEQMLMRDQTDRSWSLSKHTQLIYDFSQPDSPKFRLLCTSPDHLDPVEKKKFEQLNLPGFVIPKTMELRRRETLDRYLSQALSIPLTEDENGNQVLQCIDEEKFVLTLDFTLKLLNIHEHVSCGAPCVMEGETGVSKTALTKMYSILVNSQQMRIASLSTMKTLELIEKRLVTSYSGVPDDKTDSLGRILHFLETSPQHTATDVDRVMNIILDEIDLACSRRSLLFRNMPSRFESSEENNDKLARTQELLAWFSESHLESIFFDINIDASLTSDDIKEKLSEAKRVARKVAGLNMKVVVFLDEINTASVLGLIKEIIVDRSVNGELLEDNIVIVAACNPVRESSLAKERMNRVNDLGREWVSGHYQVRQLPLSLKMICWDYGALKREQEEEFIQQRILMMGENIPNSLTSRMTVILSSSHEFVRELARDHIIMSCSAVNMQESEAVLRARSVVSLRDIQRVFHLTDFFLNHFTLESISERTTTHRFRRAMLVSVGIVYYLRLDSSARNVFVKKMNSLPTEKEEECNLLDALGSAIDGVVEATVIPEGISLTSGLKENIFVTLVCTLSRTPLMIIGPPGCSKTLAVSIVNDNANGEESPSQYFRNFARIQPFHYQCSKSSTSKEVANVFSRAEQRQMNVDRARQQCLVFMDEAGLPEEERESLKVLHYLLEGHMSATPNVAFVCITNHILDAAKSNRCACLLRPEPDIDELSCISNGVLGDDVELVCLNEEMMEMKEFSKRMCFSYMDLMKMKDTDRFGFFVHFFGLRDFIHFLKFMRRSAPAVKDSVLYITTQVFLNALERNFNGIDKEKFANTCAYFLAKALSSRDLIEPALKKYLRDPVEVIHDALSEQPKNNVSRFNRPRYKMVIDHTNDDSVTRLLQIAGVLNSSHAFFKLSGIKEGEEIEKLNLVSRVKFAAQYGEKTVVLSQVESVSECFYDLFNQHFKEFKKDDEVSYFANIAIGGISRPCLISPSFQCIVHVQANQLNTLPSPYLNRFEKFQLNIDDILRWRLNQLPPGLRDILKESLIRAQEFVTSIGSSSIWSPSAEDTLKSIFISLIRYGPCSGIHSAEGRYGDSFTLDVLEFIESNFDVDMKDEDIKCCIGLTRIEHGSTKDGIELEKVVECYSKGGISRPFEDILSGCLLSPLSRTLKQIILSAITRCVVIRLLELVKPNELYLRRHFVPSDVLQIYFGEQEHFSLKKLIGKLCESGETTNQFYMIYARSDSCAHSMPTWSNNNDKESIDSSIPNRVRSLIHDNPAAVEIHHLDLLKSESDIKTTFDSWASTLHSNLFLLVVDMKQQSANIVNFIRSYVEQTNLPLGKKFLLLLHFPLSCDNSTYPSLFLGKWRCIFLDGIGDVDGNNVDLNNVLQSACSFKAQELNGDSLLQALRPKALQYVASQVPFYSCSTQPQSINQVMPFSDRMARIGELLASKLEQVTLETLLCRKYIAMWTGDQIHEIVYSSAYALASGLSKLSFSSSLIGTLQSSFNKFLAKSVLEINVWANLDALDSSSANEETEKIFALVLNSLPLPGVPLQELLLLRDINCRLQPLPTEMKSRTAKVAFPFFYQVSSLIEMAIDVSNFDFLDQTSMHQSDDCSPQFLERVNTTLNEMTDRVGTMTGAVCDVVACVAASECLFDSYLQHILAWSYGCKNSAQVENWIRHKMYTASNAYESFHCNIVYLHIICRKNVGGILRISSWDSQDIAKDLLRSCNVQFEGITFVSTVVTHFCRLVSEKVEAKEWSRSFSVFLQSIPALMEGGEIEDEDIIVSLRLLILLNILVSVDASERAMNMVVQLITKEKTPNQIVTVSGCLDLLGSLNETLEKTGDARDKLLRIFFSPCWLKTLSRKVYNEDALFLISVVKERRDYINHQMAVIHLRNVLTCREINGNRSALPTSSFIPSLVVHLSLQLNTTHVESFSESGDRVGMPHFVPQWLSTDGINTHSMIDGDIDDEIGWYFRNYYQNSFECPLANVISDVIVGKLLEETNGINSDELLIMFQTSIEEQKEVNQATHARLMRRSGQASLQGPTSVRGCYIRALETDALLTIFVCKVAEELSLASRSFALEGVNASCALRILNHIMQFFRWPDLFFKIIMRLSGNGHLANLLSEGGPLNNFDWCQKWIQGLSSHQREVQEKLSRAEDALREANIDEDIKARQYRRCPHCNELFGIDQTNCGVFYCGRDAHGANGRPTIGGRAVQGGYGCGREFTLHTSIPYTRDEALLEPLREELRASATLFEAYNRGAELWARTELFDIPTTSFRVRINDGVGMLKIFSICLVDYFNSTAECEKMNRLASILEQLPRLEHVSCLPDMIEFYVFVHKTFRHVVTREESFNMKLQDIMDERLLKSRFGSVHASYLKSLWLRLVENFNSYLSANDNRVSFDCEDVQIPFSDLRDVPLIQVLSGAEHPSDGHDSLFLVISELLMRYNNFIRSVSTFKNAFSDEKLEEIHPRSLVNGSQKSIAVKAITDSVASTLTNLIASFWDRDEKSFVLEGLLGAIQREFDIIGSLQTVMAPSFLREKFVFRDGNVGNRSRLDNSDQCFYSSDKQFYFAQREDWMLYEDVRNKATRKCFVDVKESTCSIRHLMIKTFRLSHGEWTGLLEGMRNMIDELDLSNADFGGALKLLGIDALEAVGFPYLDGTGSDFIRSLSQDDIVEFIDVCGEQLSSEAYRFNRLPSRLSEPMPTETKQLLENSIQLLLQTHPGSDMQNEIHSFCEETLSHYESHIVTVSEKSNEPLCSYLKRNNACDDSESVFSALPIDLGLRNYIDIQKFFHQLKLKLRQGKYCENNVCSEELPDYLETHSSNPWKWIARPIHKRGVEEKYQDSIIDRLWFDEAIRPRDVDPPTMMEQETDQTASKDSEIPPLDDGSVADDAEEVTHDRDETVEAVDKVVDGDSRDATNPLPILHAIVENQVDGKGVLTAREVSDEVKKKERQLPVVLVAFVVVLIALVCAHYYWPALAIDDEAEVESNGMEECKVDFMTALAIESNDQEMDSLSS